MDTAESGEEGLGLIAKGKYDIMLVDYNMPGCSGTVVIRAAAGEKVFPPIIMVTSENSAKVAADAMKLGATDFLTKDTDLRYLEMLPDLITRALAIRQQQDEHELMTLKLKENEERYRSLVNLSPDGIGLLTNEFFDFLNPSGRQLLNIPRLEDLQGSPLGTRKRFSEFIVLEDRVRFLSKMGQIASGTDQTQAWEEFSINREDLPAGIIYIELVGIAFNWEGKKSIQIMFRDITLRKETMSQLEHRALTDPLTKLPNRVLFTDRLAQAIKEAQRYKHVVAVLFLDLDRFKEVNDNLGHDAGDEVLLEIESRMSSAVRQCDTVGRIAGDEFCILLSIINDTPNAVMVAQKLLAEIQSPIRTRRGVCTVGVSIGISFYPHNAVCTSVLLQQADSAMYYAKRNGRNQTVCFREGMGLSPKDLPVAS